MNKFLKQAQELGARAALEDFGLSGLGTALLGGAAGAGTGALIGNLIDRYRGEEGYFGDQRGSRIGTALGALLGGVGATYGRDKVAFPVTVVEREAPTDYIGRSDLAGLGSSLAGMAVPFIGGAAGAGTGALIGNLIDRYRGEEGYFGDQRGSQVGAALGALLGGVGATYGGLRAAKNIAEEEPIEAVVSPGYGGEGINVSPVVNKNLLARGASLGLATSSPVVGALSGGAIGAGLGHLVDMYRDEEGSFGDNLGLGVGGALGGVLGGLGGLYKGHKAHKSILDAEPKSAIVYYDGEK